jgi:FkbM family methyltransferase
MKVADLTWLPKLFHVQTIIDVGANSGEYADFLRKLFGAKTVHAIEPQKEHVAQLCQRGFVVHPVALSNTSGVEAGFNVCEADPASSLLDTTDRLIEEYPQSVPCKRIFVPLMRLDDLEMELIPDLLVKIDAQGAEREILQGGKRVLSLADVVLIEMTFVEFYKGQALFNELHAALDGLGLHLQGFRSLHLSSIDRRPLFAHCIYCRNIQSVCGEKHAQTSFR